MHPYLRYALDRQEQIVALIRRLVEVESPSDFPWGVDRLVEVLVEETSDIATAKVFANERFGKHLRLEFNVPGDPTGRQILALGHGDTVWPSGTLAQMPFREEDGRLWGPGVLDMKAGLAFFLYAMRALRELKTPVNCPVVLLIVSDEEVGSLGSRPLTEAEAEKSRAVLVLEPGTGLQGKLKTARKGVARYVIHIDGEASHAGVDFEAGASAILEAAQQIQRLAAMTNLAAGTTVNAGVIRGGTRSNVVAAAAEIEVDVRALTAGDADGIHERMLHLQPFDSRCRIRVDGGPNRPPMERTNRIAELFEMARKICVELGVDLQESATGGGSDGNFTAALGVPTLDGLGAVGEGAHAPGESILSDRIADRVALLAALVEKLASQPDERVSTS